MKKSLVIISLLFITGCYTNTHSKEMQPEKAFKELTTIKFFTKKEPRATMLQKLALRILKAVEGHINDVVTITTKHANSFKAAVSERAEKDNAGRPKTIAQTEEFITFINELKQLSENIKFSINEKIIPLLERKIDTANTEQLDNASLYIRQQYDKLLKKSIAQLELSLPELQRANTLDRQMELIKQYVDIAIRHFLKSTIEDNYESVIEALKKLKVPMYLPNKLEFDSLKSHYGISAMNKTERIKEQVKQERKNINNLFTE